MTTTLSAGDWIAIVGIVVTVSAAFGGWMFSVDRKVTRIETQIKTSGDSETQLWLVHREDVKELGQLDRRVTVLEAESKTWHLHGRPAT